MTQKRIAIILGGVFWFGAIAFLLLAARGSLPTSGGSETSANSAKSSPSVTGQLVEYWLASRQEIRLILPEVPAKDGDPIFVHGEDGDWREAGYLTYTDSSNSAKKALAVWHATSIEPWECRFEYHRNRGKFADIVRMLLPPEKRERVEAIIRQSLETDGQEIVDAMRPIVTRSMQQSLPVVERAFRQSIADHRDELEVIGERYRATVLDERLVPLLKEEVLPIVKHHAEPVAERIGKELWDRASVWRFGWRFLYDRTPLPERDLVKREFDRFVKEEAIPVFESHTDEMLEAQKNIFRDISNNERVRSELSEVVTEISKDAELRQLLTAILRESIVENKELRQVWLENWQSEEAKAAFQLAGDRLEPVVRKIGDELFGTRETGISPSFARVLRNQILGKDKRWIVAIAHSESASLAPAPASGKAGPYEVVEGSNNMAFPLIIMAGSDDILDE